MNLSTIKESQTRQPTNYKRVLLAGLALGLVSLLVVQELRTRPDTIHLISGITIILLALTPLLLQIIRHGHTHLDLFHPAIAFTGVYGIMFGFGLIRHYTYNFPIQNYSFAYILLGYIGLFTGLLINNKPHPHTPPKPYRPWPTTPLLTLTTLLFLTCFAIFLRTTLQTGWLLSQTNIENLRTETITQIGGVSFYIIRTLLIPIFLASLLLLRHRPLKRWAYPLLLTIITLSLLALLATGYRNGLIVASIGVLAMLHYLLRPLRLHTIISLAIPFVIIIGILGAWRTGWNISPQTTFIRTWLEIGLPLGTMQITAEGIPELTPHLYGRGMLMAFLVLLPGEQPALSLWLKDQLGLTFAGGGFTPSILGGFYLDFGLIGILIGMFCIGLLLQTAYRWFRNAPSDYSLIFYCFLLTACIQSIRDGFLQDIFPVWFLCVLVGLHIISTKIPTLKITYNK